MRTVPSSEEGTDLVSTPTRRSSWLLLGAVLLVGANLRGAIAAVSPVLPQVREDLSMSPVAAGLLTALPVVCFALLAPLSAWLGARVGVRRAVLIGLAAIAVGTAVRVAGGSLTLLAGTVVLGAGMAVGNVLVPVVVKAQTGSRAGPVTGWFTAALCCGAAATAALTLPLADLVGWRWALSSWAWLAIVAMVVWRLGVAGGESRPDADDAVPVGPRVVWRNGTAWAIATVLGAQAASYFALTAWLPTMMLEDLGLDEAAGGVATSVFQVLGIAGTLLVPLVVPLRPTQGWIGVGVAACWAVTVGGLLAVPAWWLVWTVVGGIAQGAGIAFAFTLLVLRSADEVVARQMSSMAQFVGYGVGAASPIAVGALNEATGGWTIPMLLVLGLSVVLALASILSGRGAIVGAAPSSPVAALSGSNGAAGPREVGES